MSAETSYDFDALLSLRGLRETQLVRVSASALVPDSVVDVRYEGIPLGALYAATEWLASNRVIIRDEEIAGTKLEGVWRTVSIQEQLIVEGGRKVGSVLVQRFAKGLYDRLDWTVCRVVQGYAGLGTNAAAEDIEETDTDGYQRWSVVRMPYVRPECAKAIAENLKDISWTDLVIGGVKHDGEWINLGATWRMEEDNTASVIIKLARPKLTFKCYRNSDGIESQDIYIITGVPVCQAQAILDAWKEGRRGADGNIDVGGGDSGVVSLTLSVPSATEKNSILTRSMEDAFHIVTVTVDANKLSPIDRPVFEVGKIHEVENEETNLGKYRVTRKLDEAKTGETPEHVVAKMLDGTTLRAHSARHLDQASLPAWAEEPSVATEGVAVRITRQLNEYGGLTVDRQERVVSEVRRPAIPNTFYAYDRGYGTAYAYEYDHVSPSNLSVRLNELSGYRETHTISPSFDYDAATGTFSVRVIAIPGGGGSSGGGAKAFKRQWYEYKLHTRTTKNEDGSVNTEYAHLKYYVGVIQDRDIGVVQSWLESGGDPPNNVGRGVTEIVPLGRWGFRGTYSVLDDAYASTAEWKRMGA